MKNIKVTMPDHSVWMVPVSAIEDYHFPPDSGVTLDWMFPTDPVGIMAFARRTPWDFLEDKATMIEPPESDVDYHLHWMSGEHEIE